ncbi:hypothetical protein FOS14_20255 [Skermania sp. ID1734]|uniref:YciI family protein n=1 Tax=Skermania sp. ID1734 TaxID=2597516 RepID=UPI00117F534B|nr:YciI family protein [Skermania sp. ID1734]TSD94642.1 hypothetical protein FOS14_20255 [Skermania sp. ID1734]
MAQYAVLIYEDENGYANADKKVWDEILEAHNKFGANAGPAIVGGNALQPTSTATSIRADGNGSLSVTDGPFAETKEALGGFYLIEAPDLDAAIELAKQVPARFGGVEVRPVMVFD